MGLAALPACTSLFRMRIEGKCDNDHFLELLPMDGRKATA
jgi:hypothetical protein